MSAAFELLRVGDAFWIDDVEYVAVGCADLRADEEEWREWLLAPRDIAAEDALRTGRHRWLSRESSEGLRLWTPIALPETVDAPSLKLGHRLRYRDRDYRVEDRYRFHASEIFGDVGGDVSLQESFDAVDLRGGPQQLSIEWNARGIDATLGRHIGSHELLRWSREAGGAFATRVRDLGTSRVQAGGAKGHASSMFDSTHPIWQWLVGGAVMLSVIVLQRCDSDCEQRLNPTTGKYQSYCDDGIRSGGRRNFGSWGGK